ncbi:MAG TPA: helix-turn-helix transcriptional regulator [Geminicoccaceae bacterium]|nr:helix-turn-helix transcriptional regulator [Geminicoccaceae bacterium]
MRTASEAHRTLDLDGFSRVVDRVYAAGCHETSWDRTVEELCRVAGFDGCALSSADSLEPYPVVHAAHGPGGRAAGGHERGWIPLNPLLTDDVLRSTPGTVWHDRRIMPPELLATTAFWTRWMQPNGFASWACVILGRQGGQVVYLEVYGRPGGASTRPQAFDLLARLAPHLTRAWRLGATAGSAPRHGATAFAGAPPGEAEGAASPASDVAGTLAVIRLRAEFGLTKAEARLALHLAAGASLPSMAKAFGVKLTTIRSQLQQVFGKTDTSRQAELVTLLLSRGYVDPRPKPTEPVREFARRGPSCFASTWT